MRITLPGIGPALISGWLLAFTLSLDDLVIASFVTGPSATTLPMAVFSSVRLGVNLLLTPDNVGTIHRSLEALLDLGVQAVTFLRPKGAWATEHWPGFPDAHQLTRLARDLQFFLRTRPPLRLYVDTALRGEWARMGLLEDPEPEVLGCGGGQRENHHDAQRLGRESNRVGG